MITTLHINRIILFIALLCLNFTLDAQSTVKQSRFNVLVLAENGGHHILFTQAVKPWLTQLASDSSFSVSYITNTEPITEDFLKSYQLFIQLDYPPYGWTEKASAAFQKYIEQGQGGWIGFHHATLLGEFDGYPMWNWFSTFMGGITYKNYIPTFVSGNVKIEDVAHPVMKGVPTSFIIGKEEWYSYSKSPRAKVHVIASVDESSYVPDSDIKMGDHPVIWSNTNYRAKNVYIFIGHSPELMLNSAYTTVFKNAIFWAVKTKK